MNIKKIQKLQRAYKALKDEGIQRTILNFFKRHTPPYTDAAFHKFISAAGHDVHEAESMVYDMLGSLLAGGVSAGREIDYDRRELALGMEAEKEHTDNEVIARKIALDHLAEDPKYYSKLKRAGL